MSKCFKITASDSARAPKPPEELVAALLPVELWQRIAACMGLKSFARSLAPSCKATWSLQLVDVDLEGGVAGDPANLSKTDSSSSLWLS